MEHYIMDATDHTFRSLKSTSATETVFNALLGILPKARVILVHPAQANTKLCGNPYAYPSKILCCFPANRAIFTQNKQQFDKPFQFWALLFVT